MVDVSLRKIRLGHVPVKVRETTKAMGIFDGPDRLNLILVNVVLQFPSKNFRIIQSSARIDLVLLCRLRILTGVMELNVSFPWAIRPSLSFPPGPFWNSDFEYDIVTLRIVGHDGLAERVLRCEIEWY